MFHRLQHEHTKLTFYWAQCPYGAFFVVIFVNLTSSQ